MSEVDDFLAEVLPLHIQGADAIHRGDPTPFIDLWATADPVTMFGGMMPAQTGQNGVSETVRSVASRFSDCTPLSFDLVAADVSGDLAYTVGYERSTVSIDGGPMQASDLRVTHIYRRENGKWKMVHRHGGGGPPDQRPTVEGPTT